MSVELTEEEKQPSVDFLHKFASEHAGLIDENDSLPIRVLPYNIGSDERQGYIIQWALEYLRKCNCPEDLAALVTYQVTRDLFDTDNTYQIQNNTDLDGIQLKRAVLNKVHNVCVDWSHESPKMYKPERLYSTCVHAIKNTRRKMEDKHVIMPYFNHLFGLPKESPGFAFFAVYDGHGGVDAATYAAMHLHVILSQNNHLLTDPESALRESFQMTDDGFGVKARAEGLKSGCTAVTVLISDTKMYITWLGDSQVVLCKAGQPVILMEPHKPENKDERERIEAVGGCVVWFGAWRVNGSLSVSRAIGDVEHKPFVSGDPCITQHTFEGDEEFLVIGCDGLWDTVSREQAIELVKDHISRGNARNTAAKLLVDTAKEAGSSDNISVVVVYLDAHRNKNTPQEVTSPFIVKDQLDSVTHDSKNGSKDSLIDSNLIPDNEGKQNDKRHNIQTTGKDLDQNVSVVAKVRISTEITEKVKPKNMTCKVTCTNEHSYQNGGQPSQSKKAPETCTCTSGLTTKSADNSPKPRRKMKSDNSKTSTQVSRSKVKHRSNPNRLVVHEESDSRRKSAPGAFMSS